MKLPRLPKTLPKQLFFLGILAFLIALVTVNSSAVPRCRGCNVILISVDTFAAKNLSLYGYERPTTPFLSKISEERGIVFDHAVSQSSWTFPSHTAMLTGSYAHDLGVWTPLDKLPDKARTIAEVLKERGFVTQGFSNGFFIQPEWGFDQGFDGFSGRLLPSKPSDWNDSPQIFEDGLSWLAGNSEKPFFLFLRPWHMNGRASFYTSEALSAVGVDAPSGQPGFTNADIISANTRSTGPTSEEIERARSNYDAKVREVDDGLKTFFEGLEALNLSKNTIVILVSDHGEEFGEHGTTRFHAALYDETIHVPLAIFLPDSRPIRVPGAVEVRSIPATILDLLGISSEPSFLGKSLFPPTNSRVKDIVALSFTALDHEWFFGLDSDKKTNLEKAQGIISQVGKTVFPAERQKTMEDPFTTSAISDNWQIIKNRSGEFELYNLKKDPGAKENLFDKWASLDASDRREALKVIEALGEGVPVPCGQYCDATDD